MSVQFQIQINVDDTSQIHLIGTNNDQTLHLRLEDISSTTRRFYHGDICTYNVENQELTIISSQIGQKIIVGDIKLDKKIVHGLNKKGYPFYIFTPTNKRFPKCLVAINNKIPQQHHQAVFIILIKYRSWTSTLPTGELIRVLGPIDNELAQYYRVLYEHEVLPRKTIGITQGIPYSVSIFDIFQQKKDININQYQFMSDLRIMTIDPPNSLDIDDGLSYEFIRINGANDLDIHRVGIHITDVSFWVNYFDLFKYLDERQFTLYTKIEIFNIFPKIFSQHLFSLKTNQSRLAISLFVDFIYDKNEKKYIQHHHFFKQTIIDVKKNLTYEKANSLIETHKQPRKWSAFSKDLRKLFDISKDIVPECNIKIFDSHEMVQKYMIFCNKLVAEHLLRIDNFHPILRTHDYDHQQDKDKINQIANEKVRKFIQYFLSEPGAYKTADNTNANYYHFGLNLPYYTHFTSPIRRSVDIYNQFLLKRTFNHDEPPLKLCLGWDVVQLNNALKLNKCIQRKMTLIGIKKTLKTQPYCGDGYLIDFNLVRMTIYFPDLDFVHRHSFGSQLSEILKCTEDVLYIPNIAPLTRFEVIRSSLRVVDDEIIWSYDGVSVVGTISCS